MRKFTSPENAGFDLTQPQVAAFNFIEGKILAREFTFTVPYTVAKHADAMGALLRESGWSLLISKGESTTWSLAPIG